MRKRPASTSQVNLEACQTYATARLGTSAKASDQSARELRRLLQQRPLEQRGWLRHAQGHDRRASAEDPGGEGSEVGGGAKAAAASSAAGCVIRFGATVRESHFTTATAAWQEPLPRLACQVDVRKAISGPRGNSRRRVTGDEHTADPAWIALELAMLKLE